MPSTDVAATPKKADNAFDALNPGKARRCTDVLCLLLFFVFWAGMIWIVAVGFSTGDPDRLIYGLDYKFDQCNRDNSAAARGLASLDAKISNDEGTVERQIKLGGKDLTSRDLFYAIGAGPPRFQSSYVGVCQAGCPNEGLSEIGYKPSEWVCTGKYYGQTNKPDLSLPSVPSITSFTEAGVKAFADAVRDFVSNPKGLEEQAAYLGSFFLVKGGDGCPDDADNDAPECTICYPSYPTVRYSPAFCVPNVTFIKENAQRVTAIFGEAFNMTAIQQRTDAALGGGGNAAMRIAQDALSAMPIILGCIAFSVVLGFVWAYLMRLFIKPMVVATLLGVAGCLGLFTALLYAKSGEMRASDLYASDETFKRYADVTYGGFAFAAALLCVYVVIVGCFWKRIWLVCGVVIEASKALAAMPTLLFAPLIPAALTFALLVYFIFGAFFILSAGELKLDGSGFAQIEYDDNLRGALAYHFFGCVWGGVLLNHVTWSVIAFSVAQWYFARDKVADLGVAPVVAATRRVLRYHLGTVVFGSLTVAIVKYVRYMMNFVKQYADPENRYYGFVVKCVWCCIDCCLRSFEKLLEFISKNAYILCAVEGEPFCTSARHAFGYVVSNLGGIALLNTIGDLFLFLGKFFVAAASAGVCACVLMFVPSFQVSTNSIVLPCIIVFIASYVIASIFMGIFEMTIDTVFMCFCIDEDKQLGYADGALKSFVKENVRDIEKKTSTMDAKGKGTPTVVDQGPSASGTSA
ncbi:hypothetical protein KFE25_007696 [Diacronema lutheri]|uniref:Choline transporter-like protein n=1 Tax=Diacronema lutheri TaxID=2081491 RepID=A0A8J6CIT0_DIALT|nr:hypothetical protein KFE25_007696 [Diacronema lutheri]